MRWSRRGRKTGQDYLDDVANEIRENLVLLYLFAVVADLFFHDALLVLQPEGFGFHDLGVSARSAGIYG